LITSYELQWDAGNSASTTWYELQGSSGSLSTATSYSTNSVTSGASYRVRVRALNKYGWGEFSDETTIIAAQAPNAPTTVSTTQVGTDVVIQWSQPTNNGAAVS